MKKEEIKKVIFKIIVILCISLFLEIFLFNMRSFRLVGKNYQSKTVSIEDCEVVGIEKRTGEKGEALYEVTSDMPIIKIPNINQEVGTLYWNVQRVDDIHSFSFRTFFSDETSENLRELPTKTINSRVYSTRFVSLRLTGDAKQINLNLNVPKGTLFVLNGFELNKSIPFDFQMFRLITIFLIIWGIYELFHAKVLQEKIDFKQKKQLIITIGMTCVICLLFAQYTIQAMPNTSLLAEKEGEGIRHTYIYEVEYTKALSQGSLKLLMEPEETLLNLENPYDETARIAAGFDQIYDHVYYQGNYYVYFSILPQLILVPFHLLTGQYLNSLWLIIVFAVLGIICTVQLTKKIFAYWFPETKFGHFFLATLLMLFANSLLYTAATPAVYELVAVLGYWLVIGGMNQILGAFTTEKGKVFYGKLATGCLMLACSVSARPNLLLISLLVLPIFIRYFISFWKNRKENKKDWVKYILAILIPYLAIGITLMVLNYVRFDSITEFGARYQLTSNDMEKLGYRMETIPIGIWHYFFNPADISTEFPFINTRPNTPEYMGFYGSGFAGVGIFLLMPISILVFFLPTLRKHIQEKYAGLWWLLLDAIIVAVISAISVTLVGASYNRYSLDFIWLMVVAGICMMEIVWQIAEKEELLEKIARGIFTVLTLVTICISLGISLRSESRYFERIYPIDYMKLRHSICFWE